MSLRSHIETLFVEHTAELVHYPGFSALESGQAGREEHLRFIENVVRAHLKSPQLLAFLFALAPPEAAATLQHNMLEELGIEEESGRAHPSLLKQLAIGAGLAAQLPELEAAAAENLRHTICEPLLYSTLREVGLAALCEICAFEFMLARVAGRIAHFLSLHGGLSPTALEWFTHHSAVDVQHAEQGLDNLVAYARYYEFSEEDAFTIVEMVLRENVFIKRYFGEMSHPRFSFSNEEVASCN